MNQKSKLAACILAYFLGGFGIHDFYLGNTTNGIIKIVLTCCTGIGGTIWSIVDLVNLLNDKISTDATGNPLKREF